MTEPMTNLAREALAHPQVLQGAWMRVNAWYGSATLAPEPELSHWRLHPEGELRRLRDDLRSGTWEPSPWTQLPYPKKGARLRHYVQPTVRDQVAFMAHMVLLGPLIDSEVPSFAFGNRWYRPVIWDRRLDRPRWRLLPYPLLTRRTFLPYARDHGLFRRVAHWTAARMLNVEVREEDYSGRIQHPNDHYEKAVPPWVAAGWWPATRSSDRRVFWAALDIQLAYPCVQLDQLGHQLTEMLDRTRSERFHELLGDYPAAVTTALADPAARKALVESTISALQKVRLGVPSIPDDTWRPHHLRAQLPDPDKAVGIGLPTGLAVSGVLFNAALARFDRAVWDRLLAPEGLRTSAFVRFADDMYLMARSPGALFALMDTVGRALAEDPGATLADRTSVTNLFLSVDKVRPEPVKKALLSYLKSRGWKRCKTCKSWTCPDKGRRRRSVEDWWSNRGFRTTRQREALLRASVGPQDLGPFVTTLVERLSAIGTDTLADRFGAEAEDRRARLHELARFDIDDEQVNGDTRRAFAVNRLVRTWLPPDAGEAGQALEEIRESVAHVLQNTPWRFSLWHAVVRAAGRREGDLSGSKSDAEDVAARQWLQDQLHRIAVRQADGTSESWVALWPEDEHGRHESGGSWKELYLSFHRAAFWQSLAGVLREVWWHAERARAPRPGEREVAPTRWTVRAIPEARLNAVTRFLGGIEQWARVLYPDKDDCSAVRNFPWEASELVAAVLASQQRGTLARAFSRAPATAEALSVPDPLLTKLGVRTLACLEAAQRIARPGVPAGALSAASLAHVRLGGADRRLGRFLSPRGMGRNIAQTEKAPNQIVAVANALGCADSIGMELPATILGSPTEMVRRFRRDPYAFSEYHIARRIYLANGGRSQVDEITLHRLLWGPRPGDSDLAAWRPRSWELPAIGLPSRVAAFLCVAAMRTEPPDGWSPEQGPLNWCFRDRDTVLSAGRRLQFGYGTDNQSAQRNSPVVSRTRAWEIPPHAAFFLPLDAGTDDISPKAYLTYCDVLLLITAMDGGEAVLDGLVERGLGGTPFEDRWAWRSRLHLPGEVWRQIERIVRWPSAPDPILMGATDLYGALREIAPTCLGIGHFRTERIDIALNLGADLEVARTVGALDSTAVGETATVPLDPSQLSESLVVRIGQISRWYNARVRRRRFPSVGVQRATHTMEQVASAFRTPSYSKDSLSPAIVVLPEVTVPECEVETVRQLATDANRAYLAGLYWRVLRPAYPASRFKRVTEWWIVNEAELAVPIGGEDRGPTGLRWYRVRKPVPSHMEMGLARALTTSQTQWRFMRGSHVYRFLHPNWGDFSVAICADLIESSLWRDLQGDLLHLFMVAFNRDVDFYDSLTRVRSYENFVNLVAANHGRYGGSLACSPRRGFEKEIARLRGNELFVLADVHLPVKDLYAAQLDGVPRAELAAETKWTTGSSSRDEYKAPPPGFVRREAEGGE